nr:hypothetical protein [Tanacetum cinerariifolium]
MDSVIPLGQKNTPTEYMILTDADNRPPMLDKHLYDSWKSRMELYMQNKEHGRMILESVKHGPLIWPTIEENGVTRTKKYAELSAAEKIQADCNVKATNIILQGDDPIACLNKAIVFLTVVASSMFPSTNNQLRTSSNPRNHVTIQDDRVTIQQVQRRQGKSYFGTGYKSNATSFGGNNASGQENNEAMLAEAQKTGQILDEEQLAFLVDPGVPDGQAIQTIIPNNAAFQTEDLDTYDSDCDDVSNAKAVLMDNISNYGSDIILEVPHSKTYLNDMKNQSVHAMDDFEQTPVVDVTDNEITSNSDIIPREKMIDSQMDDMIKEKLALKEQVDSLEQNLSKQIKQKESLLQTFTVLKNESKEKENKYMENKIDLEKKIKELDNIIFKVGQSAQTKAQRIKPTLYDGIVISNKHVAMPVIDDEETLILKELSRSKKEKDPEAIRQKIYHKPIDYVKLNKLYENFRKRFVPQQELSADEAFWYHMLNPSTKSSDTLHVKIEAPKELHKVNLVNESLKNLKLNLANFNKVVKIMTTPNARTEGMFKLDLDHLALKLLQNKKAHIDYLKYTQEQDDSLRRIVEQAKAKQPLDNALDFTYKHAKRIQDLLV